MKIETIDIIANEYFDKKNGNSYFNADIVLNYGKPDKIKIHIPMQYGYGEQYEHEAKEAINNLGILKIEGPLWRYCKENNIQLRSSKFENCKEKELRLQDKENEKSYLINFEGRSNKAIGITKNYKRTVTALDINKAILKLYNNFEHIRVNSIRQLT